MGYSFDYIEVIGIHIKRNIIANNILINILISPPGIRWFIPCHEIYGQMLRRQLTGKQWLHRSGPTFPKADTLGCSNNHPIGYVDSRSCGARATHSSFFELYAETAFWSFKKILNLENSVLYKPEKVTTRNTRILSCTKLTKSGI
jgi:hypothetical protein